MVFSIFPLSKVIQGNGKSYLFPFPFQCAFSNGGHLFAAVTSNIIQIFSTTTFESVSNLKGHSGRVKAITWFPDDSKIVSCGMDGAVYEWDPYSGKRTGDCVLKSCSYYGVATSPDGKNTFAVGSDKTLKEITLAEANVSIVEKKFKLYATVILKWNSIDCWSILVYFVYFFFHLCRS